MDRLKKAFRSKDASAAQHGAVRSGVGGARGSPETSTGSDSERAAAAAAGGRTADTAGTDKPAEGFLCPVCMTSFDDVDTLQSHFEAAHAEAPSSPAPSLQKPREETLSDELGLMRMQLTASEESRLLHLREFIELQRQTEELKLEHAQVLAALAEERRTAAIVRRDADDAASESIALRKDLATTSATVRSLESQLTDEKSARADLASRISHLEGQLSRATDSSSRLAAELATAQAEAAAAEKARADLSQQLSDCEHRAASSRLQADAAMVELQRLAEEAASKDRQARDELEQVRRGAAALREQLQVAQDRLAAEDRTRTTLHKLQSGEQAIEDTVAQLQEENVRLSAKLESVMRLSNQEKEELWTAFRDKERDLAASYESQLKIHQQSAADAAKRLQDVERHLSAEAAQYKEELETSRCKIVELQCALADADAKLQVENEKSREMISAAEAARLADEQTVRQLTAKLQLAEAEQANELAKGEASDAKLVAAEAALAQSQLELEASLRRLGEQRDTVALLEQELNSAKVSMEATKAQHLASAAELQQKLTAVEQEAAEQKVDLANSRALLSESESRVAQLESELSLSLHAHQEMQSSLGSLLAISQKDVEVARQELQRETAKFQQELMHSRELLEQTEHAAASGAAELQIKCSEKEQTCIQLRSELEVVQSDKALLEQELNAKTSELTRYQVDLETASKEKVELSNRCVTLTATLAETTDKCKNLELQTNEMSAEIISLKLLIEQKTLEYLELGRSHASAIDHLAQQAKSERAAALTEQAKSMQAKFDALLDEHDKTSRERLLHECAEVERSKQLELAALAEQLRTERMHAEEAEVRGNMQLVSLNENLATVKTDLTATQEKLMDVVKQNDQLRCTLLELEAKLENSKEDRRVLLQRCLESEHENTRLKEELSSSRRRFDEKEAALQELSRENQMLQIKAARALARKWAEDSEVSECSSCAKAFSVTVRKHHCRNCGNIFCHECSSQSASTPSSPKPVRVCDTCFRDLDGRSPGSIM